MEVKKIQITCDTKLRIPYQELHGIQGALKMLTRENFEKLRKHILEDGINFALHVWKETKKVKSKSEAKRIASATGGKDDKFTVVKWWIIDGHGRHAVIKHLIEKDEFKCEDLPCVEIQAKSFKEAKRKVLNASSAFHTTTKQGLYEFMTDAGLSIEEMEQFELPEIDMPEFKMEFFDSPEEKPEEEKETVTFDAYKNAQVKQIVLYFAADDYEKMIGKLDSYMTKAGLEDYSQVVWKLVNEAL